ncbi:ankyrin repeat domain-containing protein [Flavobacterium sp. 3HN19-14]|uniref:ankyrin repeat domain-containing protein n=1 Tax=Flavobacterium sp. 3HN19-14 TaxID=3448133 RepID=UPI003EE2B62E
MRKTIICLAMACMSFTNFALAANSQNAVTASIAKTYSEGTPLCLAICKGDVEIVKKFIEYGADVNENSNGMTPLMYAARYNHVEIMKYLIENGADVKQKDGKGNTALKYAEMSKAYAAVQFLKELPKK